jgi:hypothetical protein
MADQFFSTSKWDLAILNGDCCDVDAKRAIGCFKFQLLCMLCSYRCYDVESWRAII